MAEAETEVAEKKKHLHRNHRQQQQGRDPGAGGHRPSDQAGGDRAARRDRGGLPLAEIRHNGEQHIVGDADHVTVTKKSKFVATAPDDNS